MGRGFTWYKSNGATKNRIDKVLVSRSWLNIWPTYAQYVLERNILDHCPLVMKSSNVNWGPKPFRALDCWFLDNKFEAFVMNEWSFMRVQG